MERRAIGEPVAQPDGAIRNLPFGTAGAVTYLALERDLRVDVLLVTWAAMS